MNHTEHKAVVKQLTDSGVTEFQAHYVALAIEYAIGSKEFKQAYGTHGVKYLNDFVAQSLPVDVYAAAAADLYDDNFEQTRADIKASTGVLIGK